MTTRFVATQPGTIATTIYPYDSETATDADSATQVTVSIAHANGTDTILASTAATRTQLGTYQATVPAYGKPAAGLATWQATVNGQVVKWTDPVEVVGAEWCTIAELRALDGLNNTTKYTTALLVQKRLTCEAFFESATGKAWTPKYARDVLDGDPMYRRANMMMDQYEFFHLTRRIMLSHRRPRYLLSVSLDDGSGPVAQSDLTTYKLYDSGEVERLITSPGFPRGVDNVIIEYVHGEDGPPEDLRDAFKRYVRYCVLNDSNRIPDRANTVTNEMGTFTLAQSKAFAAPTGISEIDAVLLRYGARDPAFA